MFHVKQVGSSGEHVYIRHSHTGMKSQIQGVCDEFACIFHIFVDLAGGDDETVTRIHNGGDAHSQNRNTQYLFR